MARGPVGKYCCEKCKKEISLLAKTRHDRACDGVPRIYKTAHSSSLICKFCENEFATAAGCGVHQVQCLKNPNRRNIQKGRTCWCKGLSKENDARLAKTSETTKENYKSGKIKKSGCVSVEWYENGGKQQLAENGGRNGGYKERAGRSKKFKVYDSFGHQTTLQSTYEYAVFEILCELEIRWIRPKALKYGNRNYFADFYLVDFDTWLDPKNTYKAKCDAEKIAAVIEQNGVRLLVISQAQISKSYIASLVK